MKPPKRPSILLALSMTVTLLSVGQPMGGKQSEDSPRLMTPAEYQDFVGSLKTDLARWRLQLIDVHVARLPSGVDPKMLLKGQLSLANHGIDSALKVVSKPARRQSLGDNIRLLSAVEKTLTGLAHVTRTLGQLTGVSANADLWASQVARLWRQAEEDRLKLYRHLLALSDLADASCAQLAP